MLRSGGEATAFHEAVPGHHLQLALSGELEGVPDFMRHGIRAARLVVDTGLHAFGWSRQRALDWMTDHTPLPPATIASEAERRLGGRFEVRGFHDVDRWISSKR